MSKKIFKSIKVASILASSVLLFGSCTVDFEDINRPRYQVSEEEQGRNNFLLKGKIEEMIKYVYSVQENNYQMHNNLIGDQYGRYMMLTKSDWNKKSHTTYNAPDHWLDSPFNVLIAQFYPAWRVVKEKTEGKGMVFQWAQVLRVATMLRVADMHGPIPYRGVEGVSKEVPYESQDAVYKAFLEDLDVAIEELTLFVQTNPGTKTMASQDIVYGGDHLQWVKYANSLKLRIAMRIKNVEPILAKAKAEEAVNHPLGLIESNADNAALTFKNPIWVMWASYGDAVACADITAWMTGYDDPRLPKYFSKISAGSATGYFGQRSGADVNDGTSKLYSTPIIEEHDRLLFFPAAEVAFLKAEGALSGWSMGGTAKSFYERGIELSFQQWGAGSASTYMNDNTKVPGDFNDPLGPNSITNQSTTKIKWDDALPQADKLEKLMTQKWIAMYPIGHEAWCDYRRTGYPKFFPIATNTSYSNLVVANRIPFAPAEYKQSEKTMEAAVALLGGIDNYATKLWWQN